MIANFVVRELWDYLRDDTTMSPEDFHAFLDDDARWYVSWEDGDIVGVYYAHRINTATWEVHTHVRPKFWGSGKGLSHSRAGLDAIIADTRALKIIATIPASAGPVLQVAESLGFEREGRRKESFLRDGILHDEIIFGLSTGISQ